MFYEFNFFCLLLTFLNYIIHDFQKEKTRLKLEIETDHFKSITATKFCVDIFVFHEQSVLYSTVRYGRPTKMQSTIRKSTKRAKFQHIYYIYLLTNMIYSLDGKHE